ncbi:MAG: methyltransferase [Bacteroidetes bacterium]|nr:MAG: methyltransferase [Bacteroidota bacterium]
MDFIDKALETYAKEHTTPEPDSWVELTRETWLNKLHPRMLSGHLQGAFLSMISQMINPDRILEIGTFTGYSALALAKGLSKTGLLYTLDINKEHESLALKHFATDGISQKVKMIIGNALEIIPTLNEKWDLVFIDADKINYLEYFDLVFDKVKPGGWIIADNALWSGKVLIETDLKDKDTAAIKEFNDKIQADQRIENMLLPFRDGLMLMRKK